MNKVFKVYRDGSHGWLAVKFNLLEELGLLSSVSPHSYSKGKTAYLEEDSDWRLFQIAYETLHGPLQTVTTDHGDRSWVRNMTPFKHNENFSLTKDSTVETSEESAT